MYKIRRYATILEIINTRSERKTHVFLFVQLLVELYHHTPRHYFRHLGAGARFLRFFEIFAGIRPFGLDGERSFENAARKNGCAVTVQPVQGKLTDNYNPKTGVLSLSEATYNSSSVAALGVAAHEVGHAVQHENNYIPLKLRSVIVPVVNFGTRMAIPLVLIGVLLEWIVAATPEVGSAFISLGIICYSLATVFALITIPVELNASRRAKKMLLETGVLEEDEVRDVSKVLSAAAMTYFASLLVSLLYFLRFLMIVSRFKRND